MVQINLNTANAIGSSPATSPQTYWWWAYIYLNLDDIMNTAIDINPVTGIINDPFFLIEYKSQLSNSVVRFNPFLSITTVLSVERTITLLYKVTKEIDSDLENGMVKFGNNNYPYGLYDMKIYEMSDDGDLTPADAIKTLYTGLMNLQSIKYPEIENKAYQRYDSDPSTTQPAYSTSYPYYDPT